ncbi:MAG: NAD(P)-dependent oxidoreductase [Agarilytica sp.]
MAFKVLARLVPGEYTRYLRESFDDSNFELVLLDDAHAAEWPKLFLDISPAAVINFRPIEDERHECSTIQTLVDLCESGSVPFLYFSSYQVFGQCDDAQELIEVDELNGDDQNPWQACEALCSKLEKHIILRLSWVLGGEFENVLHRFLPPLLERSAMFVSDHNFGRPLHVKNIADATVALIQQVQCDAANWGVFHLHASDKCSEAEITDTLVRLLNSDFDMNLEMPSVAAPGDERRLLAGSACLSGERLTRNFGVQCSSWRKGLKVAVANALEAHNAEEGQELKGS